jgi:DNA-binding HxlR family transcriptional regulator
MALLDLLGRRWALRILWELRSGPMTFRALRERCDEMSPSVLNTRLADLRAAEIVAEPGADGFELTVRGRKLIDALRPLDAWARGWKPNR